MKLQNCFRVDLPVAETWATLLDIPSVVPCMPGAELLAVEDDNAYRGQVKVKLGPVAVAFQGRAKLVEVDESSRTVRVNASGNENKGRGSAQAVVVFKLAPEGEATRVDIVTDLTLAGAVAQYGRAQGVIADVSRVMVNSFADNLKARIASGDDGAPVRAAKPVSAISVLGAVVRSKFSKDKESGQS
ncbi:SRPBCC family protein [Microbacteriaceae bacterium K1510]|nr:SRPBCC family protein [Microbacteriaceae bacterium K1510]